MKLPTLALALALLCCAGCKLLRPSPSPVDSAAKHLAGTVQTVDVAMHNHARSVASDAVKVEDQITVKALYENYQAAVHVAESEIASAIRSGDSGRLAKTTADLTYAREALLGYLAKLNKPPP